MSVLVVCPKCGGQTDTGFRCMRCGESAVMPISAETPFLGAARAQTMLRDFDRLRQAIRAHDSFAAESAWEKCERWVDQLRPVTRNGRDGQ